MHYEYANVNRKASGPHVIGNVDGRGGRSKCNLN